MIALMDYRPNNSTTASSTADWDWEVTCAHCDGTIYSRTTLQTRSSPQWLESEPCVEPEPEPRATPKKRSDQIEASREGFKFTTRVPIHRTGTRRTATATRNWRRKE